MLGTDPYVHLNKKAVRGAELSLRQVEHKSDLPRVGWHKSHVWHYHKGDERFGIFSDVVRVTPARSFRMQNELYCASSTGTGLLILRIPLCR